MTKRRTCPLCKDPMVEDFHPFCSRGCRDKDLLQWFGEGYSVPGEPAMIPDGEADGFD